MPEKETNSIKKIGFFSGFSTLLNAVLGTCIVFYGIFYQDVSCIYFGGGMVMGESVTTSLLNGYVLKKHGG